MNFLSSALNSLTGKSIPYNLGEPVNVQECIWKVYDGTKREDSSPCTIFHFDSTTSTGLEPLAKNALRKIRGLKLPNVLKVLDTFEYDNNYYVITERVVPLSQIFRSQSLDEELKTLIIYSVAKAIKFINVEGSSVLGYLNFDSVFVNIEGEIRLGGFEVLTNLQSDPEQPIYNYSSRLPWFNELLSPEVSQSGVQVLKGSQTVKFDSWRLGVFIYKLFNNGSIPSSVAELARAQGVPRSLLAGVKKLLSTSVTPRASIEMFFKNGEQTFFNTSLISFVNDLNEFQFKNEDEKFHVFQNLDQVKDSAPPGLLENRIIPELIKFYQANTTQASYALRLILSLAETLTPEQHIKLINPVIVQSFTLPDRVVRMLLLTVLPKYIDHLGKSDVSDKIFSNFVTGFSDSNPAIREETLKATLLITPKLSDRQLNNDLLRYLAKTQNDEKPEIRTNTTILIGKIAKDLNKQSRSTVLATAFSKALKDPFIHSRLAALLALTSSIEFFTPEIIANKILTVIAPSLLDKSSKVREEAQKAFDLFFQKIKQEAAGLPQDQDDDSEAVQEVTNNVKNFGLNLTNAFTSIATGLGGSLNQDVNNSTPDLTRQNTPTPPVVAAFNKPATYEKAPKKPQYHNWDEEIEADDGWAVGDAEFEEQVAAAEPPKIRPLSNVTPKNTKPKVIAPKVTSLVTQEKSTLKKKGLQLKPKSKLKLDLDDDQDDSWGDGW